MSKSPITSPSRSIRHKNVYEHYYSILSWATKPRTALIAVTIAAMTLLLQGGLEFSRAQSLAWAAGEPIIASDDAPLESQLIFTLPAFTPLGSAVPSRSAVVSRPAADFADLRLGLDVALERLSRLAQSDVIPSGCEIYGLNAAPRGPWVVTRLGCGRHSSVMQVIHAGSGQAKTIGADLGGHTFFLGWSPNGNEALVRAKGNGEPQIYHIRLSDGIALPLNLPSDVYDVVISPNGRKIVYSLTRGLGFGSETWVADLDGRDAQRLIRDPDHIIAFPRFSPEGDRIAYIRMPDSNIPFTIGELWVMDANGNNQTLLAQADAGHGYEPAWSPDGAHIAFVQRENGADIIADQVGDNLISNVYIVDVDTKTVVAVTEFSEAMVENPVWSPDGLSLAFSVKQNGVFDVWAFDWDGKALSRVTSGANTRYPTWLFGK